MPTEDDKADALARAEFQALGNVKSTKKPPGVSREVFKEHASFLPVTVNGTEMSASPKEFSTGSYGWHCATKMVVTINGVPVDVLVNLNLTVINSKPKKE